MITLPIKPISVNACWQGMRYATPLYKRFQHEMNLILPPIKIGKAPYKLTIEFGFSSKLSDIDNGLKPLLDCLVKKYGFDDRDIYILHVNKVLVKKTKEYVKFELVSI